MSTAKQVQLPQIMRPSTKLKLCSLGQNMIAAFMELTTGNPFLCWFSQRMLGRSIKMGQKYSIVLLLCVTCKRIQTHWTCNFIPISGPLWLMDWAFAWQLKPSKYPYLVRAPVGVVLRINLPTAVFWVTAQAGMGA